MKPDKDKHKERRQNSVQDLFDQVLNRHIQRLMGASYRPGDPPANSTTLSLLILLMDRKNEIDNFPSGTSEHYTHETLAAALEEMGFDSGKDLKGVIEDMVHKDYILVDNGRLLTKKPSINMARLLDQVFPKMPGMNFVAYVVQTMDEVKSNRKDLDSALSQFDQMLQIQGVPLVKEPRSSKVLGSRNHAARSEYARTASSKPKVLSSDAIKEKVRIKRVDFGMSSQKEASIEKDTPDANKRVEPEKTDVQSKEEKKEPYEIAGPESFELASDASFSSPQIPQSEPEPTGTKKDQIQLEKNETEHPRTDSIEDGNSKNEEAADNKPDTVDTDDEIENRIAAFEEDLAMECPMCRRSKVKSEKTKVGKYYYKCQNKTCNFISWGKPYHIFCPRCKNPFLVESSDSTGKTILKCPRATCRYWQAFPPDPAISRKVELKSTVQENRQQTSVSLKPRRKIVKKRVVRRKKSG